MSWALGAGTVGRMQFVAFTVPLLSSRGLPGCPAPRGHHKGSGLDPAHAGHGIALEEGFTAPPLVLDFDTAEPDPCAFTCKAWAYGSAFAAAIRTEAR